MITISSVYEEKLIPITRKESVRYELKSIDDDESPHSLVLSSIVVLYLQYITVFFVSRILFCDTPLFIIVYYTFFENVLRFRLDLNCASCFFLYLPFLPSKYNLIKGLIRI